MATIIVTVLAFLAAFWVHDRTANLLASIAIFFVVVFSVGYVAVEMGFIVDSCDPMLDRYCDGYQR